MKWDVDGMKMKTLRRNTAGSIYKGYELMVGLEGPFGQEQARVA